MTDLSKGIIETDGFVISSKTTKEDLMTAFGDKLSPRSSNKSLRFLRAFNIDGHEFMAWFFVSDDGRLLSLELTPRINYKSEDWDRAGQQEERREFCDKWLYERLGEPHESISGDYIYTFSNLTITCFSNFDPRDGANAGYVVIDYLKVENQHE